MRSTLRCLSPRMLVDVGLEFHVQLSTGTKMFSPSPTVTSTGAAPNSSVAALDAGLPGALPLVSCEAVDAGVTLGLALGGDIAPRSVFDRKHYFYPDMPVGYQITQRMVPLVSGGALDLGPRCADADADADAAADVDATADVDVYPPVPIEYCSLEQDSGKQVAARDPGSALLDLNRAGMPLMEVVTAPAITSPDMARAALRSIQLLVRSLGVSSGNLEDGSLRCDVNVSVRESADAPLGVRTEVKNVNSVKAIGRAIEFEAARQADALARGESLLMETRGYDARTSSTYLLRSKESVTDYRFFPDPDLPPLHVSPSRVAELAATLPELPYATQGRMAAQYGLDMAKAGRLLELADAVPFFEEVMSAAPPALAPSVADFVINEYFGRYEACGDSPVSPPLLARIFSLLDDGQVSRKVARSLFLELHRNAPDAPRPDAVDALLDARGWRLASDADALNLDALCSGVLADHPETVAKYKGGNNRVLGFFIAQVMKATRGAAPPEQVAATFKSLLDE